MKFRRILAVLKKQMLDTAHNTGILVSFAVFPLICLIFVMMRSDGSEIYRMSIVMSMSTVFTGMTPFTAVNGIIREDKFTGVTRMLIMSNVKPLEYLIGITLYIMSFSCVIAVIFGLIGGLTGISLLLFVLSILLGTLTTLVFGSLMTVQTKNQSAASAVVSMIAIFNGTVPTIAASNPAFSKIARFWYTTQINALLGNVRDCYYANIPERLLIIGANLAVFTVLFTVLFKKNKIIVK